MDLPKSRRTAPQSHVRNCSQSGRSRPNRARSCWRISSDTAPRSPAIRSSTTSPGTMRIRKKISTATPSSVGNMRQKRLSRYFHISVRGPVHLARLLGEPHRVELVVQVMARCDRPPLHLRAVRDDPVPLERVQHVDLLVDEASLERPEVPLALVGVARARLLLIELVD